MLNLCKRGIEIAKPQCYFLNQKTFSILLLFLFLQPTFGQSLRLSEVNDFYPKDFQSFNTTDSTTVYLFSFSKGDVENGKQNHSIIMLDQNLDKVLEIDLQLRRKEYVVETVFDGVNIFTKTLSVKKSLFYYKQFNLLGTLTYEDERSANYREINSYINKHGKQHNYKSVHSITGMGFVEYLSSEDLEEYSVRFLPNSLSTIKPWVYKGNNDAKKQICQYIDFNNGLIISQVKKRRKKNVLVKSLQCLRIEDGTLTLEVGLSHPEKEIYPRRIEVGKDGIELIGTYEYKKNHHQGICRWHISLDGEVDCMEYYNLYQALEFDIANSSIESNLLQEENIFYLHDFHKQSNGDILVIGEQHFIYVNEGRAAMNLINVASIISMVNGGPGYLVFINPFKIGVGDLVAFQFDASINLKKAYAFPKPGKIIELKHLDSPTISSIGLGLSRGGFFDFAFSNSLGECFYSIEMKDIDDDVCDFLGVISNDTNLVSSQTIEILDQPFGELVKVLPTKMSSKVLLLYYYELAQLLTAKFQETY